jgi:hypothetical protein
VSFGSLSISVQADAETVRDELEERLAPFAEIDGAGRTSGPTEVEIRVATGEVELSAEPVLPALLRPGSATWPRRAAVRSSSDGREVVRDLTSGTLFAFRTGCRVMHVLGPTHADAARDCRRLVQDLMRLWSRGHGAPVLHAGCVGLADGRGILIAGPSGAGKSTLVMRLLDCPGTSYVANDEVFLDPRPPPTAHGSPVRLNVRLALAESHPGLADVARALAAPGAQKHPLQYREFAGRIGSPLQAAAALGAILFPDSAARGFEPMAAGDVAQALGALERWTATWPTPWRDFLGPAAEGAPPQGWAETVADAVAGWRTGWDVGRADLLRWIGRRPGLAGGRPA